MPNLSKEQAQKIREAGGEMANWLHNMAYFHTFQNFHLQMREMVAKWDAVKNLLVAAERIRKQ